MLRETLSDIDVKAEPSKISSAPPPIPASAPVGKLPARLKNMKKSLKYRVDQPNTSTSGSGLTSHEGEPVTPSSPESSVAASKAINAVPGDHDDPIGTEENAANTESTAGGAQESPVHVANSAPVLNQNGEEAADPIAQTYSSGSELTSHGGELVTPSSPESVAAKAAISQAYSNRFQGPILSVSDSEDSDFWTNSYSKTFLSDDDDAAGETQNSTGDSELLHPYWLRAPPPVLKVPPALPESLPPP